MPFRTLPFSRRLEQVIGLICIVKDKQPSALSYVTKLALEKLENIYLYVVPSREFNLV